MMTTLIARSLAIASSASCSALMSPTDSALRAPGRFIVSVAMPPRSARFRIGSAASADCGFALASAVIEVSSLSRKDRPHAAPVPERQALIFILSETKELSQQLRPPTLRQDPSLRSR
jgi:hypothetical protein